MVGEPYLRARSGVSGADPSHSVQCAGTWARTNALARFLRACHVRAAAIVDQLDGETHRSASACRASSIGHSPIGPQPEHDAAKRSSARFIARKRRIFASVSRIFVSTRRLTSAQEVLGSTRKDSSSRISSSRKPRSRWLPTVALSYGEAFHVNDPRIGTTAIRGGTFISRARAYQLVVRRTIAKTDWKVTLSRVTTAKTSHFLGRTISDAEGIVKTSPRSSPRRADFSGSRG